MEYSHKELRQEMIDVCLESLHEGLFTGTSGNLSVALGDGTMLITPTSVRYTVMRPMDIVRCDLDGKVLEGELRPSSEWRMHAAVYRAYPEIRAIFHTHSPYATAFAVVHKPIPAVLIETMIMTATRAAMGICLTHSSRNTTSISNTTPAVSVDNRPRPPDFTLITDWPIMAHPAIPPIKPVAILAMP